MSETTQRTWGQQAAAFISRLQALDSGGKARLRRNAGRTLAEGRDIHRPFYQALPQDVAQWQHETYFLIATLFPLAKHVPQDSAGFSNFGSTLRRVAELRGQGSGTASSLDRRVQHLLDSDKTQLPFRLRQLVRLVSANKVAIDWTRLLLDLLDWEHQDHKVQLRWARQYFVGPYASSTTDTLATEEEHNDAR